MAVDIDMFITIMADYEVGADLTDNPFDESMIDDANATKASMVFLEGGAIPDTVKHGGDESAIALAGFLQGLAIGYEYARRKP